MATSHPTFHPLGGGKPWPTGFTTSSIAARTEGGIQLGAAENGPYSLFGSPETLGGLTLPRKVAIDSAGCPYLLHETIISKYDEKKDAFIPLRFIGGQGHDARQFDQPKTISISGDLLVVADTGNRRVQIFALPSLGLKYLWNATEFADWNPIDIAAHDCFVYILDAAFGRVYRYTVGHDRPELLIEKPEADWSRVTCSQHGDIYLFDKQSCQLNRYNRDGKLHNGSFDSADAVRDQFQQPETLLVKPRQSDRPLLHFTQLPIKPIESPNSTEIYAQIQASDLFYDLKGDRVCFQADAFSLPAALEKKGIWISQVLDSKLYECQWHKIELLVGMLSSGSRIVIHTYSTDTQPETSLPNEATDYFKNVHSVNSVYNDSSYFQETGYVHSGEGQLPKGQSNTQELLDILIQSRNGRYLWLYIEFEGDGHTSPVIYQADVHYPRDSYTTYLPDVFSSDEESRWFLERYLSIAQTSWDDLAGEIKTLERYFDPNAVPDGPFMTYLADWLALPLEGDWDWDKKRNLLAAAPMIYKRRGTPDSLRQYLEIYVQNITGLTPDEQNGRIQIVEGFNQRQVVQSEADRYGTLNVTLPLWGPQKSGRFQFDVYAELGKARLNANSDPEMDVFNDYAHTFEVFVPADWIKTAEDETLLRRAIEDEKPAHCQYTLTLVANGSQMGLQSTLGVDMVLGDYPPFLLGCNDDNNAPSRPPQHRLGINTLLGQDSGQSSALMLSDETRVGFDTILI